MTGTSFGLPPAIRSHLGAGSRGAYGEPTEFVDGSDRISEERAGIEFWVVDEHLVGVGLGAL